MKFVVPSRRVVFVHSIDFSNERLVRHALRSIIEGDEESRDWVLTWYPAAMARHFTQSQPQFLDAANHVLTPIILDHLKLWAGNLKNALEALAIAEAVGFRYQTHRETIRIFSKLIKVMQRNNFWEMHPVDAWRILLMSITGRHAPGGEEEFTQEYQDLGVPSWVPVLVAELLVESVSGEPEDSRIVEFADGSDHAVCEISGTSIWEAAQVLAKMDVTEQQIRRFIKNHGISKLIWFTELYDPNLLNHTAFSSLARNQMLISGLAVLGRCDVENLILEWQEAGRPRLDDFVHHGGTAQKYAQYLMAVKAERKRLRELNRRVIVPVVPSPRPEPEPEPEPEPQLVPDGLDFDWIMAELQVEEVFPDLDPLVVRVIIIHGLMRQGDRIMPMRRLPKRKLKKLWKECECPICSDRSVFVRTVNALTGHGLIKNKKGKYSLARQTPHNRNIHSVIEQAEAIAQTHAV